MNYVACFIREQYTAWKTKFGLKNQPNAWGNYQILYHKTNKEASTVLCSVVKHLESGRALKKWGKTLYFVFFRALPLPACFKIEQSTVEASLFVNYT